MEASRIVIVGGGFAGVTLAQRLERQTGDDVEITLVSNQNHLVFSPLLAEAVGRSVSLAHVVPGRQMVKRTRWLTARVMEIDRGRRQVHYAGVVGGGTLSYDHLVLACGAMVNMEALPGLSAHAYPFKTLGAQSSSATRS